MTWSVIGVLEDNCSSEIFLFIEITAPATGSLVVLLLNKIQHRKSILLVSFWLFPSKLLSMYHFLSFYGKYLIINILLRKKVTTISVNESASFRFPRKIFLRRKLYFTLPKMNTCSGKNEHPADWFFFQQLNFPNLTSFHSTLQTGHWSRFIEVH